MAITMHDRFLVWAPIDEVWEFLVDPRRVVLCMPGAHLDQIESDRAFLGTVKIAVGRFATNYKGRVEFTELDQSLHKVRLTAVGRERSGSAVRGSMVSSLRKVEYGTEVVVDVSLEGQIKIMEVGLGLTQNLAPELFEQFAACVKAQLETPAGAKARDGAAASAAPVQVVPLIAKAIMRRFRAKRPRK